MKMVMKKVKGHNGSQWIWKSLFFIHCSLFFSVCAEAQTFTQRIQTPVKGEGTVIIHHDDLIDQLVNDMKPATNQQPSRQPANTHQQTADTQQAPANDQTDAAVVSVKRYRTTGYRIQVFRGGNSKDDRQRAEYTGTKMREAFPNEEVYVEFFAPDWTCRVGNFREIEEARKVRDEIRRMGYDGATIVKGKIIITVPQTSTDL